MWPAFRALTVAYTDVYKRQSVAFPLLSSGNYGYPKEPAFRIAVDTITQYVMEHDLTVYLVLYDRGSLAVSRKLFASVEEYIDDHYVAPVSYTHLDVDKRQGRRRGHDHHPDFL